MVRATVLGALTALWAVAVGVGVAGAMTGDEMVCPAAACAMESSRTRPADGLSHPEIAVLYLLPATPRTIPDRKIERNPDSLSIGRLLAFNSCCGLFELRRLQASFNLGVAECDCLCRRFQRLGTRVR